MACPAYQSSLSLYLITWAFANAAGVLHPRRPLPLHATRQVCVEKLLQLSPGLRYNLFCIQSNSLSPYLIICAFSSAHSKSKSKFTAEYVCSLDHSPLTTAYTLNPSDLCTKLSLSVWNPPCRKRISTHFEICFDVF